MDSAMIARNLWRKKKGSGSFRRNAQRYRHLLNPSANSPAVFGLPSVIAPPSKSPIKPVAAESINESNEEMMEENSEITDCEYYSPDEDEFDDIGADENGCDDDKEVEIASPREPFAVFLRKWAIDFNVSQNALKPLMLELNSSCDMKLPKEPRTLMSTYNHTMNAKCYYILNVINK